MSKPIHLVLGSGGARGLAHIGVIHELEARGYRIESLTGCSMGALIGGFYVAGELDNYERWVRQLTKWDVLRFLDLTMTSFNGVMKGDRIMDKLSEWIGDVRIEDLDIPFTAVAADIKSRKEVWIRKGSLIDAIRASISMPGVFRPQLIKNRILVDGGILNPLPIPPATIDSDTRTVAVSLAGSAVKHPFGVPVDDLKEEKGEKSNGALQKRIGGFIENLSKKFGLEHEEDDQAPSMTDVLMGMFSTMQDTLARHRLASNPPDILIEIPANICDSHEYYLANRLIPAGEHWAKRALD